MPKIKCTYDIHGFRIYLDNLIHVFIERKEFSSMRAYIDVLPPEHSDPNFGAEKYVITFYTKSRNEIVCEYAEEHVWENILKAINEQL